MAKNKCPKDNRRCYVKYGAWKQFDEDGGQIREPLKCRHYDAFSSPGCWVGRPFLIRNVKSLVS